MERRQLEVRHGDGTVTICELDLVDRTVTQGPPANIPAVRSALDFETDRYVIDRIIGRGGFADVVKAYDRRLNRDVALKIPHRDGAELRAESEVAARLQHPNIVPVYDAGEGSGGAPYYAMKLLDGASLRDVLSRMADGDEETLTRYPLPRLLEAFRQVCLAVEYAHDQRLLHRDIKPANIVLGGYGEVVLVDWGIAKHIDAPEDDRVRGTLAFMAPERFERGHHGSVSTDVYGLGATLYQVLSLQPARRGTMDEVLGQILRGPPPPPSLVGTRVVPGALEALCMSALADDPHERPQSAGAMAAEIESYLDAQRDATLRRERAQRAFEQARTSLAAYDQATLDVSALRTDAAARAATILDDAPMGARRELWAAQAEVEAGEIRREVMFGRAISAFEQVLHDDDEHVLARAALAEMYWNRLLEAEAADDRVGAARYEQLVRSGGSPRFAHRLGERAHVSVECTNAPAQVSLWRFEPTGPVLQLVDLRDQQPSPAAFDVDAGSFALRFDADGCRSMWVPFVARRGQQIHLTRRMYTTVEAPENFVVVTGRADDFALSQFPVTVREFVAFLDAQTAAGVDVEQYLQGGVSRYFVRKDGNWALPEADAEGDRWSESWPMVLIRREVAEYYIAWLSEMRGRQFRLPSKDEWEWAATGADGRRYPWGPGVDSGCADLRTKLDMRATPSTVGTYETDRSPFGVFDMGGVVSEWTSTVDPRSGAGVLKGASYIGSPDMAQIAFDRFAQPSEGFTHYGFRLCMEL